MVQTDDSDGALPPIAALFVVVFDRKVGYTVAWKRSAQDIQLDGSVEFKSLPSGLHNVESDLVYFNHEQFAGVSAFQSSPAGEEHRNAHFVAVGVLVPLSYGRLGRAWLHAQGLRRLAESTLHDIKDSQELGQYWNDHRLDGENEQIRTAALAEPSSPVDVKPSARHRSKRSSRALSDATGFSPSDHVLSPDHPALSMPLLLDTFGPLLFPIYRAALLRKRLLLLSTPPVQKSCDFVYDISIFSNVPPSLVELLPTNESMFRIRPLFSLGVHDIPDLEMMCADGNDNNSTNESWVACTTDDILGTKTKLFDVLVTMPPAATDESSRIWPKLRTSEGAPIKATQRDLRRYVALRKALRRTRHAQVQTYGYRDHDEEEGGDDGLDDARPLIDPDSPEEADEGSLNGGAGLVEPSSWAAVAYTSFLWWASAGERDALLGDEHSQDASLLDDLSLAEPARRPGSRSSSRGKQAATDRSNSTPPIPDEQQGTAMLLIAYFHRLTSLILETLAELVTAADDETEEGMAEEAIVIESEDMRRMGLDVWSEADKQFVGEMMQLYFEREVEVQGHSVECCGIKIV